MLERRVTVETSTQPVTGKLISVSGDDAVLVRDDGQVVSVSKRDATRISIAADEAGPVSTQDAKPATEAPADDVDPSAADADEENADETEAEVRRLGLFTSHGVGYGRFRRQSDGGAVYALDIGIGYNFNERLGLYGLIGGVVGASLLDKEARGHFGHFALALRRKWKFFALIGGLGVGIAGVRGPGDARDRRVGFAMPLKAMGLIPLPKELFLGIGLGYDLGLLPGGQVVNGISLQVTVGRW
jgi:hypothetical protein